MAVYKGYKRYYLSHSKTDIIKENDIKGHKYSKNLYKILGKLERYRYSNEITHTEGDKRERALRRREKY